ncbi:MAG: helix-turn-helix transcriptional regulator [Chloroflexi bacterium]|nr:helix-turn-helix transcriptional regulator [Chloroflexota bacterium]MBL7063769.1 helix-turn-helix transcriptional regulator [Anaerolineae bacterium]
MTRTQSEVSKSLPLREPTFFILLSLARGEKHGYAIMKDIDELSLGRVKLSTGTLYEALARLLDQNLIERIDETESGEREFQKRQNHPGRPRKSYRLMQMGWRVLEAETNRMRALVAAAPLRFGGEQV